MGWLLTSRWLLFVGTAATLGALTYSQRSGEPLILTIDEGDIVGTHYIKVDPQRGSTRLGVGLQRLRGGQGIPLHMHETEDEVLIVHSGSGVGVVGDARRNVDAGTTLYIPQGTWHGVESRTGIDIFWVVSPPRFAENLRQIAATDATERSVAVLDQIGRRYGLQYARNVLLWRLAMIASVLALAGALLALFSRVALFRTVLVYALGATSAAALTIVAVGPAGLSPIIIAIATLVIAVGIFAGAFAARGVRALTRM